MAKKGRQQQTVPTKIRLAGVLRGQGLLDLVPRALGGEFDDFESQSGTPIIDLVQALRARGREDLAQRAINGEWDGTRAEAEAWYEREGKRLLEG